MKSHLITGLILIISPGIFAQEPGSNPAPKFVSENIECLQCHGRKTYFYHNEWTDMMVKERMNPYYIIDSALFYASNHRNFKCTDCHSSEYQSFPHSGLLRMELGYTCMDCHGGDENFADFQFERIEEEFIHSVHSTRHSEDFTCWMCHNPHTYRISARRDLIPDVVAYDNEICLSCHANINKFQLLTDKINPGILEKHEWLPNQKLHFLSVRCIECHAEQENDMLVAHNIKSKEEAVRLCANCHSQNSLLFTSLYKYQLKESRREKGFLAAMALQWRKNNLITAMDSIAEVNDRNESTDGSVASVVPPFIIGSGSNPLMNLISLILFFSGLLAVMVHVILRIIYKTS
ncbi:MAG TPA: cytochrome c3 family protein [Bacteroidales bacterium]|nr:cytochrome c3 family protein [Bacteroidales bacterium]